MNHRQCVWMTLWMVICLASLLPCKPARAETTSSDSISSQVGISSRLEDVVLPAPKLEVKPQMDPLAPLSVRIVSVKPHGTSFRYSFEYYGLEAGTYNLSETLQPENAATSVPLPPLNVNIVSTLPAGQITPRDPPVQPTAWFHHYQALLIAGGILWAGFLWLILTGGRRRRTISQTLSTPLTPQERLVSMVAMTSSRTLTQAEKADAERLVYATLRDSLQLDEESAAAITKLKADAKTGAIIRQLEAWLHAPSSHDVDLATIVSELQHLHRSRDDDHDDHAPSESSDAVEDVYA